MTHESPPRERGAIAEVVPPASDSNLAADSTTRMRQVLATLSWDNADIDLLLAMRCTVVVCDRGHRALLLDGQACPWCPIEDAGGLFVPQWTQDAGEPLPAVWEPLPAEQVHALSWWREVP